MCQNCHNPLRMNCVFLCKICKDRNIFCENCGAAHIHPLAKFLLQNPSEKEEEKNIRIQAILLGEHILLEPEIKVKIPAKKQCVVSETLMIVVALGNNLFIDAEKINLMEVGKNPLLCIQSKLRRVPDENIYISIIKVMAPPGEGIYRGSYRLCSEGKFIGPTISIEIEIRKY